jgi:uroporphyrinogen decarboxylase
MNSRERFLTALAGGAPDEVCRVVLECLRIGKPGGRDIISTDHSTHDGMPDENIMGYLETAKEHGIYVQ